MSSNLKLRELIVSVRLGKTSAEERQIIQKECSAIRESLKQGKEQYRSRNMLKLMYISMLGYSTDFAQMDVVKLLAQPDYGDKRVGYLTLCVLLDETTEVLTLAENVIKRDLTDKQIFTQSLALATVANVAGEDMSRDVMHECLLALNSASPTVKKKACLACLRIVRKVPEFAEVFLDKLTDIFNEKQHGFLVSGLSLVNHCLESEHGEAFLKSFRASVPTAIRLMKSLVLSVSTMDHDVNGIADPHLQVRILQFFRVVAKDCKATSDAVNDILAQVATNTDSSKNAGSAILYECARTIFAIHADDGLKVLGINILIRFLTSIRDNNQRYVALSTLLRVYRRDPEQVSKHQATVIDCLKDVDLSIRRRALELTIVLIDRTSVRNLVPDLLSYLTVCGDEMRHEVTTSICGVVEKQAPTPEWRIEMSLRLFREAKVGIKDSFAKRFVAFLTNQSKAAQEGAVQTLWEEVSGPFDAQLKNRHALLLAAVWCLGEFGDLLVARNGGGGQMSDQVATCIYTITSGVESATLKQYGLTAMAKMAAKFPSCNQLVSSAFELQSRSLNCELQQRACEYATMLEAFADLASFSLGTIPPITVAEEAPATLDGGTGMTVVTTASPEEMEKSKPSGPPPPSDDDLFGPSKPKTALTAGGNGGSNGAAPKRDAFDDLFGDSKPKTAAPTATSSSYTAQPRPVPSNTSSVDDLFGPSPSARSPSSTQPPAAGNSSHSLQNNHHSVSNQSALSDQDWGAPQSSTPSGPKKVKVHSCATFNTSMSVLSSSRSPTGHGYSTAKASLEISPTGGALMTVSQVMIAVPKTTVVEILPLASTQATSAKPVTQVVNLNFANDPNKGATISLKIRVVHSGGNEDFVVSQPMANFI